MGEENFKFSGLPTCLEWYRCYDDPAAKQWIDGMELYVHRRESEKHEVWDRKAIEKWNFFYRPFRPAIGRPQRKLIRDRVAAIRTCTKYLLETSEAIAASKKASAAAKLRTAVISSLLTLFLIGDLSRDAELSAIGLLLGVVVTAVLWSWQSGERRSRAERERLEARVLEYEAAIVENRKEIQQLEAEIRFLVAQVPTVQPVEVIEGWFREEIAILEEICLGDLGGVSIDFEQAEREWSPARTVSQHGLRILGWGYLQPASLEGPLGVEATGLGRARKELADRVETWQVGGREPVLYRLWHIQFIFPLEKNLNGCSFLYDFVTRRRYGRRWDSFQYNHVSNLSIREVDTEIETWIEAARSNSDLTASASFNALTIGTSSGAYFRCAVVDRNRSDYFAVRLKREEKLRELHTERADLEALREHSSDRDGSVPDWIAGEAERVREEEEGELFAYRAVQLEEGETSRTMLLNVRNRIESYVHRYRHADE